MCRCCMFVRTYSSTGINYYNLLLNNKQLTLFINTDHSVFLLNTFLILQIVSRVKLSLNQALLGVLVKAPSFYVKI